MTSTLELGYGHNINLKSVIPKDLIYLEYHIGQLVRFAEINRNTVLNSLILFNLDKLPSQKILDNAANRVYGEYPDNKDDIEIIYNFLKNIESVTNNAYNRLGLSYNTSFDDVIQQNIILETEFMLLSDYKKERGDYKINRILQVAALYFIIERHVWLDIIQNKNQNKYNDYTHLFIDTTNANTLKKSIKSFCQNYKKDKIELSIDADSLSLSMISDQNRDQMDIDTPSTSEMTDVDNTDELEPDTCEELVEDIVIEKSNLDRMFMIENNINQEKEIIQIDEELARDMLEKSENLLTKFNNNPCNSNTENSSGRSKRAGTIGNIILQTIAVDNINRFVVDPDSSLTLYCTGNNTDVSLRRPNVICIVFSFIMLRIKKIDERIESLFKTDITLKTLQEYIKSIYIHDSDTTLLRQIIAGSETIRFVDLLKDLNNYLNLEKGFNTQPFSFNCINLELYKSTLEYLYNLENIVYHYASNGPSFVSLFTEYRKNFRQENSEVYNVRGDIFIEYIRLLYNSLSLIFLGKARSIIKYHREQDVNITPTNQFISIENKQRDFFALKRQGDWGQIISAKKNGYVFITFDRLAFAYATLCNVPCILQRKEPNECTVHHYAYVCFTPNKAGLNPYTNINKGRNVECKTLFDGNVYKLVKNMFIERLKILNNKELPLVTDEECYQILYITMGILDSWHDWKEGRGKEKYEFDFPTILKCLNFDDSLIKYLNTMYVILGYGKVSPMTTESGPPKSTFEGHIVNSIIEIIKRNSPEQIFTVNNKAYEKHKLGISANKSEQQVYKELHGKFYNKDNVTFTPEVQYFSNYIYNFFGQHNDYIIDATSNDALFKYMHRVTGCTFWENFYSRFDGSSSRYKTAISGLKNDALYNFLYCGHTKAGNNIDYQISDYNKRENVSINKIIKEHAKKTNQKSSCYATRQTSDELVSVMQILSTSRLWKPSDNKFIHVIFGNKKNKIRKYFNIEYNKDITILEKLLKPGHTWGKDDKKYMQILPY